MEDDEKQIEKKNSLEKESAIKTSQGTPLPYQEYSSSYEARSNLLREEDGNRQYNDFALIERQFIKNNYFLDYTAGLKIESEDDIAWLFRSLEDEAIEQLFMLYKFEDDSYFVQHISSGGPTGTMCDLATIIGNAIKMNPSSVTMVHNHPSGKLACSKEDRNILKKITDSLSDSSIVVEDGIIINIRSGKYLTFSADYMETHNMVPQDQEQLPVNIYSFSKQVYAENYQPFKITDAAQCAAYLSTQRYGIADRLGMLVLNNSMEVVAKVILPENNSLLKAKEILTIYGGRSPLIFGKNISREKNEELKEYFKNTDFQLMDVMNFLSDGSSIYSYESQMLVNEDNAIYNTSQKVSEPINLNWWDKIIIPKTEDYKNFVIKKEEEDNLSPEQYFQDGEREFSDKELKYSAIYNYKENNNQIKEPDMKPIINQDKSSYFQIEDLNISTEQRRTYSHTQEYGYSDTSWDYDDDVDYNLTAEQLAKIPDVIDGVELSNNSKTTLVYEGISNYNTGESLSIKNNNIIKNYVDEHLDLREKVINNNEVNFNQTSNIMENTQKNQENNHLEVGKLATVKMEDGLFKGVIEGISDDKVTLKNLEGKTLEAKEGDVYQFFPGQKYDYSEIAKLFEQKPAGLSFEDIKQEDKTKLMRGQMSSMYQGASVNKESGEESIFDFKMKPVYDSKKAELTLEPEFKNTYPLDVTHYNKIEISAEKQEQLLAGKAITLEGTAVKTGNEYAMKLHLDTDLNKIVFDKFVNPGEEQVIKEKKKLSFPNQLAYEDWLTDDVKMFENASKINVHQLNKLCLVLDQDELNELLTDAGIEKETIDTIINSPVRLESDDALESLKSNVLGTINSAAEKVDLFKEKFTAMYQTNTNTLKR